MITTIGFNKAYETLSELENVDVGNCSIEGLGADESLYYLIIKTSAGKTYIVTCGPVDDKIEVDMSLSSMKFNEKKLKKLIYSWLNDYKKQIVEAKLIDYTTALENFPSIPDRLLGVIDDE